MNFEMKCSISFCLKDTLDTSEFPNWIHIEFLNSQEDVTPDIYSMLVLDKDTFPIYSPQRFRSEGNFDVVAFYANNFNLPKDIISACEALKETIESPGVLSGDQILALTKLGILIYDASDRRVKGASYDLLVDNEHVRSGLEVVSTTPIKIDPFDYVVVAAKESVNIPRNICGNFDLKVSMFCSGLILSNGPQVDPGYRGRLLCLLFNTSAKTYTIEQHSEDGFSTIQFHSLSKPTKSYTGRWHLVKTLKEYFAEYTDERIADRIKIVQKMRADIDKAAQDIFGLRSDISSLNSTVSTASHDIRELKGSSTKGLMIIGTIISIVVALIAVIFAVVQQKDIGQLISKVSTLEDNVKELKGKDTSKPKQEQKDSSAISKSQRSK